MRKGVTSKERLDKHDRQIAAIRTLLQEGMRMLVDTRRDIRALAASQMKTDASLRALISALRRGGGNGHSKAKVDLQ
jgi:hypothetical protein